MCVDFVLFCFALFCFDSKCPPRTLLEILDKIDGWMVGMWFEIVRERVL